MNFAVERISATDAGRFDKNIYSGQDADIVDESVFTKAGQSAPDSNEKNSYAQNRDLWLEYNPEPKGFWNWLFGKHREWKNEYLELASSAWETMSASEYEKMLLGIQESTESQDNNPFADSPEDAATEAPSKPVHDTSGLTFDNDGSPLSGVEKGLDKDGNVNSYKIYADGETTKQVDYDYYLNGDLKGFNVGRNLNESNYIVKNDNNIITVEDKGKTRMAEIDLDTLLGVFDQRDKDKIAAIMSELPAEVLLDLYNENITIGNFYDQDEETVSELLKDDVAACYRPEEDKIYLRNDNLDSRFIIHEIGHAIDYKRKTSDAIPDMITSWNDFVPTTDRDDEFSKIFNEELEEFKKAGYSDSDCYGATDEGEAFAEAYAAMYMPESVQRQMNEEEISEMYTRLGKKSPEKPTSSVSYTFEEQYNDNLYVSANTRYGNLLQYFPKTLGETERLLQEARQLPQKERGELIEK